MASASRLVSLALCLCLGAALHAAPRGAHAARAFFVFGDSLVDNGNNNYFFTQARADAPPYGIDTPDQRATGRFSNGKNVPDIISCVIERAMCHCSCIIACHSERGPACRLIN
jgi:hypothetical protein